MWIDYIGVVPSAIAIVNGFVAVVVAQFFKEHPTAKTVLVVCTGVFGCLAIGTTVYGQHQIIVQRDNDAKRKIEIRERLGLYIAEVDVLSIATADKNKPIQTDAANKLASEIEGYLGNNLGQSFAYRAHDSSGVPPVSINSGDASRDSLWYGLYVFRFRLEQFSQQISG